MLKRTDKPLRKNTVEPELLCKVLRLASLIAEGDTDLTKYDISDTYGYFDDKGRQYFPREEDRGNYTYRFNYLRIEIGDWELQIYPKGRIFQFHYGAHTYPLDQVAYVSLLIEYGYLEWVA